VRVVDPSTESSVTVVLDADSFTSDKARRDKDVRGTRFLDTAAHPTITFDSDGVRPDGDRWLVTGRVSAHGESVPVEVTVDRVGPDGDGIRIHAGSAHLDRHAFGITGGKGMVGRYLDLELDVFARLEPAP
jgi:polyisoprenoid-binding protein YceI